MLKIYLIFITKQNQDGSKSRIKKEIIKVQEFIISEIFLFLNNIGVEKAMYEEWQIQPHKY